jgi:hypothetical protein
LQGSVKGPCRHPPPSPSCHRHPPRVPATHLPRPTPPHLPAPCSNDLEMTTEEADRLKTEVARLEILSEQVRMPGPGRRCTRPCLFPCHAHCRSLAVAARCRGGPIPALEVAPTRCRSMTRVERGGGTGLARCCWVARERRRGLGAAKATGGWPPTARAHAPGASPPSPAARGRAPHPPGGPVRGQDGPDRARGQPALR